MTSSASRLSVLLALLAAPAAATSSAFDLPRLSLVDVRREEVVFDSFRATPVGFGETDHADYRRLAEGLEGTGMGFPDIFRSACALAASRGGGAQEVKVMLAGLVTWLGDRERPRAIGLQGRLDWAFHFVYGAWLESIVSGAGERAAIEKERRDAATPGNVYDLDDLAATFIGARWARREVARLAEWGDGRRHLCSLPRFELGRLAPGVVADERRIEAARAFARAALP
jgi:hypothetical protein